MKSIVVVLLVALAVAESLQIRDLHQNVVADQIKKAEGGVVLSKGEIRRAGQGTLMTETVSENTHRAQDNQWNSDDEGGTSVVLSNLNSIEQEENDHAEREEAQEARKKMGEEQREKDIAERKRQQQVAANRRENDVAAKDTADKEREERVKQQAKHEDQMLQESKKKRDAREAQSEQQDKSFKEQTAKRIAKTTEETKKKQEHMNEAATKKQKQQQEENEASVRRPQWSLRQREVLRGADMPFTGAYSYMFWIRPRAIIGGWGNILHKGQENVNRNPAIWLYPSQTRLHVRSGTNANPDWGNGGNNGCDPESQLPLNQWTHFAMIHDSWGLKVYLNGQNVCNAQIGAPVQNNGPLYVTDPWHDVAQADLADLRVYSKAISPEQIRAAIDARVGLA